MTQLTRRNLLKTGLAASAGLMSKDALCLTAAGAASAADESQAPTASTAEPAFPRQKLLLDYGWRFHLGDANDAEKDFRYGAPTREGTFAKAGQDWLHNKADGPLQHSFDDSAWRVVDLPHDWAVELPFVPVEGPFASVHAAHGGKALGREYPETSIGWYERTFDVPATDEGLRISLDFDGVFRDSIVFFNGFYIGRNLSGYAPFRFDVTDYVKYGGSNVVTVRVDATLNEGWYYEGAGIYRHTWLTKTAPLRIAQWGTAVRSEVRGAGAHISVSTEISNESAGKASGTLVSHILDADGKTVASIPGKSFVIPAQGTLTLETQALLGQAHLWSLDEPHLYRVVSRIESAGKVVDNDDVTFGIRSIRFDPDLGFFLNGKPVKIKGTCNHQDHAGVGIAVPDRIHYDRVVTLKQMGSNGWRTAHNPVAPEVLDACDRLGMMVMAETRLMASTPEGLSELSQMIRRDRNHPSIVIWSLANEEYFYQGTPTGARIISSMKLLAKQLDPTRPVTAAMNGSWGGGASGVVDVQGFNYWNGGVPDQKPSKVHLPVANDIDDFHKRFPKLPMIGTETANGSGTRGIYESDPARGYVSAYKADCADCKRGSEIWWTIYDERAFLSGGFTWVGFDYRGEPNPYDRVSISSQSGIVDTCGFPKDVYYYYKAWWGTEPVLHLFPHWNWEDKLGKSIEVRCYSNLDSVELVLNGKSLGARTITRNSHLTWTVTYEPGVIEARGFKGGKLVLTDRRETTGAPAKLVLRASQKTILADGEDVSAIAVEVQDSSGRVVPTASNKMSFKLSGPGKIIGVGNGDPSCHEADRPGAPDSAARSAFNGLCMVIVQAARQTGTIALDVSADGLEAAQVTIQSNAAKLRPAVS
jgi:beta-galactosidase